MTEEQIFDELKEVLADQLELDGVEVRRESSLRDDLGASSLEMVELVFELEKLTNTKIELDELAEVKTVDDIIQVIRSKIDP